MIGCKLSLHHKHTTRKYDVLITSVITCIMYLSLKLSLILCTFHLCYLFYYVLITFIITYIMKIVTYFITHIIYLITYFITYIMYLITYLITYVMYYVSYLYTLTKSIRSYFNHPWLMIQINYNIIVTYIIAFKYPNIRRRSKNDTSDFYYPDLLTAYEFASEF